GNEMNFWVERPGAFASPDLPFTREPDPKARDGALRSLPARFSALHPEAPLSRGVDHGQAVTPGDYARCYSLCRQEIKARPGRGEDQVLIGSVAPWNDNTAYPGNPEGDWVQYFRDILVALGPAGCDGITLHAYTHGSDPALIRSGGKMNQPFQNRHYHFFTYRDFMEAIPGDMRHLPVYITEADEDDPWEDANRGWIKEAYAEINRWNQTPGNQQIRSLILYRWPNLDRWVMENKAGVIEDFKEALLNDYRWRATPAAGLPADQLGAAAFRTGTAVHTTTIVRLRKSPGVTGKPADDVVIELPPHTPATIVQGPRNADNLVWWRISSRSADGTASDGWSAQSVAADAPLLAAGAPPTLPFAVGERIFTLDTARLRRSPGFRGKADDDIMADLPLDALATVAEGPRIVDAIVWWRIQATVDRKPVTGWVAQVAVNGQPLLASTQQAQSGEGPAQPVKPPPVAPPPVLPQGKFKTGETVFAQTFVNLRRSPGYIGKTAEDIAGEVAYGKTGRVQAGPQNADDLTWWQLAHTTSDNRALVGWAAESGPDKRELLGKSAPPPPKPIETPAPATYAVGAPVTNISPYEVNVRRSPGYVGKPEGDVAAVVPSKALLRLAEGPRQADGLSWWRVTGVENPAIEGWMAEVSPIGVRLLAPALFRNLISLGVPYSGHHPLTQLWGENPQVYGAFTYDRVALKGHNGIDIYMPIGSAILAADAGTVTNADFLPGGYGNWVRVTHRWGHSDYAHLNRSTVRPGQSVAKGAVLGESGTTGNSTGPHLHFSIRIDPYFRGDGWGGFCDPMPFLDQSKLNFTLYGRDLEAIRDIPRFAPTPPPVEEPGRPLP
ncbi:MAG TPA: peptidoglycan DD-metalloendopeptidase family protein, partial [Caldilineaceae bacterium]|nr:peptidoglycan DD-metalloendopeptidase family protein [Caldilineaceae bacterium]